MNQPGKVGGKSGVRRWSSQDGRLEAGTRGLLLRWQVIKDEEEEDGGPDTEAPAAVISH